MRKFISFSKAGYFGIVVSVTLIFIGCLWWSSNRSFSLSHESGFYNQPFELRIRKPIGARVFYTMDGSNPTVDSTEYVGPILIDDASNNPNFYANIKEVVPEYDNEDEFLEKYEIPSKPIDKCNVVRAICVDEKGEIIGKSNASYFVGYDTKDGYDGMWICSIVSDPHNFFDPITGIMVCGETMEKDENGQYRNANYSQMGLEWERKAFVQFFNPERKNVLNQECGVRIHGNVSRKNISKSFSLYSREEYDGNDKFLCDFWGEGYYPDKMMLLSGGQDEVSLVRDKMVSDLTRDFAYSSYHYVPCILFIDGEYWGIHFLTEKFDAEYFNHYFGTNKEDILVLKDFMSSPEWALSEGAFDIESDKKKWDDFAVCISGQEEMGLSQKLFENTFDFDSFLDYFATELYIARNGDWPPLNMSYWSSRGYGAKPNDGKWRFLLYDVYYDSMTSPEHDTIGYAREVFEPLNYELNNEKFYNELTTRFKEMGDTVFSEKSIGTYLDEYSELMRAPVIKHYQRFYGNKRSVDDFDAAIANIKDFFIKRKNFLHEYY